MWQWLRSLLRSAPPPAVAAPEMPPEFGGPAPPDWLIELKTWYLPGGGWHTARVALPADGGPAPARFEVAARREPRVAQTQLDPPLASRLVRALERAFPARYASVAAGCFDGLPTEVTVFRREPFLGVRATCNLGDWLGATREGRDVPTVAEIGLLLLESVPRAIGERA